MMGGIRGGGKEGGGRREGGRERGRGMCRPSHLRPAILALLMARLEDSIWALSDPPSRQTGIAPVYVTLIYQLAVRDLIIIGD